MIRLVSVDPGLGWTSITKHLKALQGEWRKPAYVTLDQDYPYETLKQYISEAGLDPVFILDATGSAALGGGLMFLSDAVFVESPSDTDKIAMRMQMVARRLGPEAHVIFDSLNHLQYYTSAGMVQEFLHFIVNRAKAEEMAIDFLVYRDDDGAKLRNAIKLYVDEEIAL